MSTALVGTVQTVWRRPGFVPRFVPALCAPFETSRCFVHVTHPIRNMGAVGVAAKFWLGREWQVGMEYVEIVCPSATTLCKILAAP